MKYRIMMLQSAHFNGNIYVNSSFWWLAKEPNYRGIGKYWLTRDEKISFPMASKRGADRGREIALELFPQATKIWITVD